MDGLTTDDLNSGNYLSTLQNKAIANHFNMQGEIEKYGSGVSRVIGLFQETGLPTPTIEEICGGIRMTTRKAGARDTEKVTENQRKILTAITNDSLASQEKIAQTVGINRANVAKNLKKLVEMGLVKRSRARQGWALGSPKQGQGVIRKHKRGVVGPATEAPHRRGSGPSPGSGTLSLRLAMEARGRLPPFLYSNAVLINAFCQQLLPKPALFLAEMSTLVA